MAQAPAPFPLASPPVFDPQRFLDQFFVELKGRSPEKNLESQLGHSVLVQLTALSQEKDSELFWDGALRLADRLERDDRFGPALALLAAISRDTEFPQFRRRAERKIGAIQGHGEGGARFEFLLGHFTKELSDPWTIAAFGAGSLAFRAAKLGTLAGLWRGAAQGFFPSRAAAQWIAVGAGLGLEVPAFVFTSKLGRELGGTPQDWSRGTLVHELASFGITALCMRGAGSATEKALQVLEGAAWTAQLPSMGRTLAPQEVGTLAGIILARQVEESFGLRPRLEGETLLADSLATYLQFKVGGRLAEETLGSNFQAIQKRLDFKVALTMIESGPGSFTLPGLNSGLVHAISTAGGQFSRYSEPGPSIPELLSKPLMSKNHDDGGKKPQLHLVKAGGNPPGSKGPGGPSAQDPKPETTPPPKVQATDEGEQIIFLSSRRMLKSGPMDEKERQFQAETDKILLGSASETRRNTLEQKVIANLPPQRREELVRNLSDLHPELVDLFGSAARDLPWQTMAQSFVEMKLMRSSPGELKAPPSFVEPNQYSRDVLAEELRLDHQRLFGSPLPSAPEALNGAVNRLSGGSVHLLGHWTQSPGTRLLMSQRLGLPGLPAESDILQAYQKWLDRPPESK